MGRKKGKRRDKKLQELLKKEGGRLEVLRRIIYEGPSPEGWRSLCIVIQNWPEARNDFLPGIEYAMALLEGWPDNTRTGADIVLAWMEPLAREKKEPRARLVRRFSIPADWSWEEIHTFCHAPESAGITSIHLPSDNFTPDGVEIVLGASFAPGLKELSVTGEEGVDASRAMEKLAREGAFPSLRSLRVGWTWGHLSLEMLGSAPWSRKLESLGVSASCDAYARGWGAWFGDRSRVPLQELRLNGVHVDRNTWKEMIRSPWLRKLQRLRVKKCSCSLREIAESPWSSSIKELDLSEVRDPEFARVLHTRPRLLGIRLAAVHMGSTVPHKPLYKVLQMRLSGAQTLAPDFWKVVGKYELPVQDRVLGLLLDSSLKVSWPEESERWCEFVRHLSHNRLVAIAHILQLSVPALMTREQLCHVIQGEIEGRLGQVVTQVTS